MADMTDDWMNPPTTSHVWAYRDAQPDDPMEYLIERERKVITFGDPLTEWGFWSKRDSAEERDAELVKLRMAHPVWHLRARDRHPYHERMRVRY